MIYTHHNVGSRANLQIELARKHETYEEIERFNFLCVIFIFLENHFIHIYQDFVGAIKQCIKEFSKDKHAINKLIHEFKNYAEKETANRIDLSWLTKRIVDKNNSGFANLILIRLVIEYRNLLFSFIETYLNLKNIGSASIVKLLNTFTDLVNRTERNAQIAMINAQTSMITQHQQQQQLLQLQPPPPQLQPPPPQLQPPPPQLQPPPPQLQPPPPQLQPPPPQLQPPPPQQQQFQFDTHQENTRNTNESNITETGDDTRNENLQIPFDSNNNEINFNYPSDQYTDAQFQSISDFFDYE